MRRAGDLFGRIVEPENLRLACWKAMKGHRHAPAARAFASWLDAELLAISGGLRRGDLPLGEAVTFTIFDPKRRQITAPCFRERVVHHAIMNVCEPIFDRTLIDDTFACRRGKGSVAALLRAREFARRDPYFLKLDVRKYFDSVDHEVLLDKLRRLFKDRPLLALLERIIRAHGGERGRGLPIGSLTSQHFANHYLGSLDRLVKEGLRIRGYVRYMDDSLIWGRSARELAGGLGEVERHLRDRLGLELKPTPYINRMEHGVDFLGARVFPGHLTLNRRGRVRFRRRLLALEASFERGEIDEDALQCRGTALVAFTRAAGVSSWRWHSRVLASAPVFGHRPHPG